MFYNDFYLEDVEWIGEMIVEGVEVFDGWVLFISGLFICLDLKSKAWQLDLENYGLILEELGVVVQVFMDNGVVGICLFIFGCMMKKYWWVLWWVIYW